MALGYPVTFATNFKGLGLPANLYAQFETLFEYVTADEVECDNTLDGICVCQANALITLLMKTSLLS